MPSLRMLPALTLPGAPPSRFRAAFLVGLAGVLFLSLYALGLLLRPSEAYLRIQSNVVYNIPATAALALATVPILRSRGRERLGWLCLVLLLATWLVGDWTYSYYDLVRNQETPFPGSADVAYYLGYLAFIAAVPLLTFPARRLQDRRWAFDGAIVMLVAGTISWEYIMKPIAAESGVASFDEAVALGYPLLDLGLLTALVVTLYASGGRFSPAALLLSVAVTFQVVTDAGYTYVVTTTGYDNVGTPLELGWLASYVLLAVCFVVPEQSASRGEATRPSLVGIVLPYALGVPLTALLVASAVRGHPSAILISGAVAAAALVLARQFFTLRDNLALLIHAANYDALTGVPNRRRFEEEARRSTEDAGPRGGGGALLVLDLDDLKAVNDGLGHHAGDEVLRQLTRSLQDRFPEPCKLARLGSDEFAILVPGADGRQAEAEANRLLQMMRQRAVLIEGRPVRTTASVGIALVPDSGCSVEELLAHADLALYEAKEAGGNQASLYDPQKGGQEQSESRLLWKQRISDALERDRLVLHAQPILDVRTGLVHEHELLVRMQADDGTLILPGEFLPVAERSGLIHEIDRWVLSQAIRLLGQRQPDASRLRFAVNLSAKAFQDADLLRFIRKQLTASGADPSRLVVEVTETAAIADLERAQRLIAGLKELGCEFALDDFGVGFSSFYHLKHLPVDYLKIDGSFIRDLPRDEVDQHLVKAMVEAAKGLRRRTVAEFVQDEATWRLLGQFGVDYGQGYYLGRPVPVFDLLRAGQSAERRAA